MGGGRRVALLFQGQGAVRVGMAAAAGLDAVPPPWWRRMDGRFRLGGGPPPQQQQQRQQPADAVDWAELGRRMDRGPADRLVATEGAQPALVLHGVAGARALAGGLERRRRTTRGGGGEREEEAAVAVDEVLADFVDCVAGHSAGEYTAVAGAGG